MAYLHIYLIYSEFMCLNILSNSTRLLWTYIPRILTFVKCPVNLDFCNKAMLRSLIFGYGHLKLQRPILSIRKYNKHKGTWNLILRFEVDVITNCSIKRVPKYVVFRLELTDTDHSRLQFYSYSSLSLKCRVRVDVTFLLR